MNGGVTPSTDVIVVGGGVSGLAAAAALAERRLSVVLLEARDRLGGRICTHRGDTRPGEVVELGAEFVHGGGDNDDLEALLRAGRVRTRDADAPMWWWSDAGLERVEDFWERVGRVADRIPARSLGWSVDDFLARRGGRIDPMDREQARHYVQSFNAAPADDLAAQPLRASRAGAEDDDRFVVNGYDGIVRVLERRCRKAGVQLRLGVSVREVTWRRHAVTIGCASERGRAAGRATVSLEARAAVITLPLGVLKSGVVRFRPTLRAKAATIRAMGWGEVMRVGLRFTRDLWKASWLPQELRATGGRAFGFVNAPGLPLPVWWAPKPPQPLLVGWAGGPAAEPLTGVSRAALRRAALESLARLSGVSRARVARDLVEVVVHDWSADPWSRGAYSYTAAGAEDAADTLAQPVCGTLFFAGEATAADPGTVPAALGSGVRAARELVDAM